MRRKTCSMNPLKQKTTMKKNSFLWAALSMTAALVMTSCSNDINDMTEAPVAPSTSKTIPYTVTVGGDEATTRATVDGDNKTLRFATGDKLYITGTNIQGVLNITDGVGAYSGATFSGELTYSGEGSPAANLELTATLVSAQQTLGTQVSVDDAGAVTVNYPTTAYCSSINDAVQKYSNLTGTSTYGARAFTLTQQTAFLNFVITFEDATTTGTELTAVVNNNSSDICSASVTTETVSEKVVAKFVLPVASGTTLSSATVKMGDKAALTISDATLAGKVYNVNRTQAAPACSYTAPTLRTGLTFNGNSSNVAGSAQALVTGGSATNATIYYSKDGTNWSTSVPTQTNAGSYTVYYKVVPDDGYTGGVESTSLGSATMAKANGFVILSPSSSTGWNALMQQVNRSSTITHHGGSLSTSTYGNVSASISGNTLNLSRPNIYSASNGSTVTVRSAETSNYKAASATYYCNS